MLPILKFFVNKLRMQKCGSPISTTTAAGNFAQLLFKNIHSQELNFNNMSLIKNLIKEPENKSKNDDKKDSEKPTTTTRIIKSATDLQRLKLEKLMKNPEKPVLIPEQRRSKDYLQTVPSFVRNVMGSSAGAGSGEFHVYRHLRRKEYARQKNIQAKSMRDELDDEYHDKIDQNRRDADEKTAKKRAKRRKKREKASPWPRPYPDQYDRGGLTPMSERKKKSEDEEKTSDSDAPTETPVAEEPAASEEPPAPEPSAPEPSSPPAEEPTQENK